MNESTLTSLVESIKGASTVTLMAVITIGALFVTERVINYFTSYRKRANGNTGNVGRPMTRSESNARLSQIDGHVKENGLAILESSHQLELTARAISVLTADVKELSKVVTQLTAQMTIVHHELERRNDSH